MSLNITLNNDYNSKSLLFSIPVHEKQDIINNQIENIFNYNPGCKIILHINPSFYDFIPQKSKYHNLFFHQTKIPYKHGHDLLAYHIANFNYCIEKNIHFDYFILSASNELYIQKGAIQQIQKYKNGLQIVEFKKDNTWHNFNKDLHLNNKIIELLSVINENKICGGQAEGQYFEKEIFKNISNIYLNLTNNNNELLTFEAEEIIPQTIFKSFNIKEFGIPLTLQNYSNNIDFNIPYIKQIIQGLKIENNTKKKALPSPHINKNSKNNVYSIKRVDREFNEIRSYLTQKGWLLNQNDFIKDYYYYSNNSCLLIKNNEHFVFHKMHSQIKDFQWVGYHLKKGNYSLRFEYKSDTFLNKFMKVGLKMHQPNVFIYSSFFKNMKLNTFQQIELHIFNKTEQDILFIFDDLNNSIQFEIKNIKCDKNNSFINNSSKKNICLLFYQNNNYENYYLTNLQENIIQVLKNIYNVHIIVFLLNNNKYEPSLIDILNPNSIHYFSHDDIYYDMFSLFKEINKEKKFHHIIIQSLSYVYLKPISDFNIIFNKVNFLSYKINNKYEYDLNLDFMIIPSIYIDLVTQYFIQLLNNKNSLLNYLEQNNIQVNKILNDFYFENHLLQYNPQKNMKIVKNGFLFHKNYTLYLEYYNTFCNFEKLNNNHFHFYKKKTNINQDFIWCGKQLSFYKDNKELNKDFIEARISFYFKNNIPFVYDKKDFGLKIHEPLTYIHDWCKSCILYEFTFIELNVKIHKKNQLIIFNFDHYLNEVDFEIKDFKIKVDYH